MSHPSCDDRARMKHQIPTFTMAQVKAINPVGLVELHHKILVAAKKHHVSPEKLTDLVIQEVFALLHRPEPSVL